MEFLEDTSYDEDKDGNILPTEKNRKNVMVDGVFKPFMLLLRESNQKHLEKYYRREGVKGICKYFEQFSQLILEDSDPSSDNVRVVLEALKGDGNELFSWSHEWMSWADFEAFVNASLDKIDAYMYSSIEDVATAEDYDTIFEMTSNNKALFDLCA